MNSEQGTKNRIPITLKPSDSETCGVGWGWAQEVNKACDEFFRGRGMPVFTCYSDYMDFQKKRIYKHFRARKGKGKNDEG